MKNEKATAKRSFSESSRRETVAFELRTEKLGSRLFSGARRGFIREVHCTAQQETACGWLSRARGGESRRFFSARGATSLAVMLRSPSLLPGRCEIAERVALQPSHVPFHCRHAHSSRCAWNFQSHCRLSFKALSASAACRRFSFGISPCQTPHQVAQNTATTGRPRNSTKPISRPARSLNATSGKTSVRPSGRKRGGGAAGAAAPAPRPLTAVTLAASQASAALRVGFKTQISPE